MWFLSKPNGDVVAAMKLIAYKHRTLSNGSLFLPGTSRIVPQVSITQSLVDAIMDLEDPEEGFPPIQEPNNFCECLNTPTRSLEDGTTICCECKKPIMNL
jgi:hypothetical protein